MNVLRRRGLSCQELVELVTDYLEGTMSPRQRARMDEHLAACRDCTAYLDQMRRTIELTGHLRVDDVEPAAMDTLLAAFRDWKA
jgi:predicted anti-sigma-YlaC factor YlaD